MRLCHVESTKAVIDEKVILAIAKVTLHPLEDKVSADIWTVHSSIKSRYDLQGELLKPSPKPQAPKGILTDTFEHLSTFSVSV